MMDDWVEEKRILDPEAINTLKAETVEMQVRLKCADEDREKENREFQTTVVDQR